LFKYDQRPDNLGKLKVLLQINIDNELTKSGVLPEKIDTILAQFEHLDKLSLRGFMCIPSPSNSGIRFARMANIFKQYPRSYQIHNSKEKYYTEYSQRKYFFS
jgi:uncharacterized pyridoxal phosphate-containing UPF0001 family protein